MIELVPDEIDPKPDAYTRLGHPIWYRNPQRTPVDHEEVVTVLAEQYRYSGHFPISILLHSWVVAEIAVMLGADTTTVGYAGVHDCHEAYSQDLPRGLKVLLSEYARIEAGWEAHVHAAFGYGPPSAGAIHVVKLADRLAVPVELGLIDMHAEHPLYAAAAAEIGDDDLLAALSAHVEELAASMPQCGAMPSPGAIAARWQALTCPHLPPLLLLEAPALQATPTLACRVIRRQRGELEGWQRRHPSDAQVLHAL